MWGGAVHDALNGADIDAELRPDLLDAFSLSTRRSAWAILQNTPEGPQRQAPRWFTGAEKQTVGAG
jgi:hypothetical protein